MLIFNILDLFHNFMNTNIRNFCFRSLDRKDNRAKNNLVRA